jgi:hypothetical protein
MGYRVNTRKKKDGSVYWRLIVESWENNERSDAHVPSDQMLAHGFLPSMTVEEAKARAKQLNAQGKLERQKQRALAGLKQRELVRSAHLPEPLLQEFEKYLQKRVDIGPNGPSKWKKAQYHWAYAQRVVQSIDMPPSRWEEEAPSIYNYFIKKKTSRFYVSKVMSVLNLWGRFLARKTGQSYIDIPSPNNYYKQLIVDAHADSGKKSKESAPLTPEMLETARERLKPEHYNWLYLSVWFGLRTGEVDGLGKPGRSRLDLKDPCGHPVLWVYQTKLVGGGVSREDRWKAIPCFRPEQLAALDLIGKHKRPLVKTVQKHIATDVNLHGGRKGFQDLMEKLGREFTELSAWLGHQSLNMTWGPYRNRKQARFKKAG